MRSDQDGWQDGIHQDDISTLIRDGLNVIALKATDTAGGCQHVTFDITIGPPASFLDLPFTYSNFASAASEWDGRTGGRVNSWFDHKYPMYTSQPASGVGQLVPWWTDQPLTNKISGTPCLDLTSPRGHCYDGHNGIDFHVDPSAPNDTPVLAAAQGIVVKKDDCTWPPSPPQTVCGPYGKHVDIYHPNRYITRYAHLAAISNTLTISSSVVARQQIGIMGWTGLGQASDRHLHFGVYYDSNNNQRVDEFQEAVDPYGWKPTTNDPWVSDRSGPTSYYQWIRNLKLSATTSITSTITLTDATGSVLVSIPGNAYSSPLTIDLTDQPVAAPSAQLRPTPRSFSMGATLPSSLRPLASSLITLTAPFTLTVNYTASDITHLSESSLGIYRWDENANTWTLLTTNVDIPDRKTTALSDRFGDFALFASPLCPADIYEPNDDYSTASLVTTDGQPLSQVFDIPSDQDWIKFNATAGFTYTIRTSNSSASADTVITLYDRDGLTPLVSDDNSGGGTASLITWRAPAAGTYFVKTQNANANVASCDVTYDVSIRGVPAIFLPLILRN